MFECVTILEIFDAVSKGVVVSLDFKNLTIKDVLTLFAPTYVRFHSDQKRRVLGNEPNKKFDFVVTLFMATENGIKMVAISGAYY